jgi:hypothetical protein
MGTPPLIPPSAAGFGDSEPVLFRLVAHPVCLALAGRRPYSDDGGASLTMNLADDGGLRPAFSLR